MRKLFGTDGVRGIANNELTITEAQKIGMAAAYNMCSENKDIYIGKDTRNSSDMFEAAVAAGLASSGANVILLGVVPTPAVSYIARMEKAAAGVMISASHNLYESNGIKIFNGDGIKLDTVEEEALEELIHLERVYACTPDKIGYIRQNNVLANNYIESLLANRAGKFTGLRVAIDCSNGSTAAVACDIFSRLGCQTLILADKPDGFNINRACGSTDIAHIKGIVKSEPFDAGFAFDGDGDRCIAIDENGGEIDGDCEMAIIAMQKKAKNALPGSKLVTTVMANYGFNEFAQKNGFFVEAADVGDRNVLTRMFETGASLGGEQSGHIISLSDSVTGDGMLTAINMLEAMVESGKPLSTLASVMVKYPQVMINVPMKDYKKAASVKKTNVVRAIAEGEKELNGKGRILVRPSGTEPIIRVMAEGKDEYMVNRIAERIASELAGF